jgi:galactose mutarotase-like enzyme
MYLNLFKRWLANVWDGMFPRGFRRSSALPIIVIVLVVVLPIVAWKLHREGKFGKLKRGIAGEPETIVVVGPRPGGLDPIVLTRGQTPGSNMPEFRSATLLPGLGMQVLQITAFVPSKGEVTLLEAPTVKDLADGTTPTRVGPNDRWGAIEVPWAGVVTGLLTPVGTSVRTSWRGKTIEAPTGGLGRPIAEGGMLNSLSADTSQSTPETQPTSASATFRGTDFDQHWPSRNDVSVSATLSARTIDLTVTVKNTGDQPEPMGIGWHPRFVIPSGDRDGVELRLPGGEQLEIADHAKGTPSGKISPAGVAISRFQLRPWPIGAESVDAALVHLKPALMDSGESAEIRDPESQFGIRMTAVSDNMRELRLNSPGGSNYVSLGMQTNLDDPFGKEWASGDTIDTLMPGQTAEWKLRLEIFSISNHPASSR